MSRTIILGPVAFRIMGTYNSETEYEKLDVVLYENVSYVAKSIVQGQPPLNTEYWEPLGVSGADLSEYYTKDEVDDLLDDKYEKPDSGIPKSDLSSAVQTSLEKADSALQAHQDISGKEDKTNKVASISSSSTDDEYPSAKSVHTYVEAKIGNIETILEELDIGGGV